MNLRSCAKLALQLVVTITASIGLLWGGAPLPAVASLVGDPLERTVPNVTVDHAWAPDRSESPLQGTNWWASVQEDIHRSEYQVTWQERPDLTGVGPGSGAAAYQAPNRAHNLRTYFMPSGIHVLPRTGDVSDWEWGLTLVGYGDASNLRPVEPARMSVTDHHVEYDHGSLIEWYDNDARGLEQGFTLVVPPEPAVGAPETEIVLELALSGDLIPRLVDAGSEHGGAAIEFLTPGGVRVLRYGHLYAHDAAGRPLPAHLDLFPSDGHGTRNSQPATRNLVLSAVKGTQLVVRITVDTQAAIYPITIDPLATSPSWTAEGNQVGAWFGAAVGTAGDVNGDGYADVVVGAYRYDGGQADEGRAFLYPGSASGLHATAAWTAESNQAGAQFGVSVGTAGDVNGDGYADAIIGASWYDDGQRNEGRAYVYHGSSTGLTTGSADWTAESDQAWARFGVSVGTAGDVNGDGYADVIVGAPWYDRARSFGGGRAYLYHGSSTGLTTGLADWTAKGARSHAQFGTSVGTAGDVNGDGYADVIIGVPGYARAYVYYGNGGLGLSLNPNQWRSDDSAPIAHLGRSEENAFRLTMLGRTPFGRGRVKLEWEVKPLGAPFDGSGTGQSSAWIDTGTAGAQLNERASGLLPDTAHHWRVRLRYHPATLPFQQHSRWLTMPWNGWTEQDLRTGLPSDAFLYLPLALRDHSPTP